MSAKVPLVELIAEIHWSSESASAIQAPGFGGDQFGNQILFGASADPEVWFMNFGVQAHKLGFSAIERLVPHGFPVISHQPVYRFNRPSTETKDALFQVGVGLFTCNALRPYMGWAAFKTLLDQGIDSLLTVLSESQKKKGFSRIVLRYIDAFDGEDRGGLSTVQFLNQRLGFSVSLPEALVLPQTPVQAAMNFSFPLDKAMQMSVSISEGAAGGVPALIMDTSVSQTGGISPIKEDLLSLFQTAHDHCKKAFEVTWLKSN